jgi:hypothetical protein
MPCALPGLLPQALPTAFALLAKVPGSSFPASFRSPGIEKKIALREVALGNFPLLRLIFGLRASAITRKPKVMSKHHHYCNNLSVVIDVHVRHGRAVDLDL